MKKVEFKYSPICEDNSEMVVVDGRPVGTFFTVEEGWDCYYYEGMISREDFEKRKSTRRFSWGELDYDVAKDKLRKLLQK